MQRLNVHDLSTSLRGRNFIKAQEKLELSAYRDSGGTWTIGWGHTEKVYGTMKISQSQAEDLFRHDLYRCESAIRHYVRVPLSQDEFDALISFVFNVGAAALASSTLLKMVNDSDYSGASDQLLRWNHDDGVVVAGLTKRRRDERLLFTSHLS